MKTTFKEYLIEKDYSKIDTKLEYHNNLNPRLWENFKLNTKVEQTLERIAQDFISYLNIPKNSVVDIIITGSNCSYNFSKLSDIDLHLVINEKAVCKDCPGDFIDDCFRAKKSVWNKEHDITIHGYPVELYAQPEDDKLVAAGIYSIKQKRWLKKPNVNQPHDYDSTSVKLKAGEVMDDIDSVIENNVTDKDSLNDIKDRIKRLRQAGLEQKSEYSAENLAFKTIRNNNYIDKLDNYIKKMDDDALSLK